MSDLEGPSPEEWFDIRKFKFREVLDQLSDLPDDIAVAMATSDYYFLGSRSAVSLIYEVLSEVKLRDAAEASVMAEVLALLDKLAFSIDIVLDSGLTDEQVEFASTQLRVDRKFSEIVNGSLPELKP